MINKLNDDYDYRDKDVRALIRFALFLSCLFYGYAIPQLYDRNTVELLKVVMPFGALISAVLVAKVADRLLTHNKIVREDDRRQDIVRISHHLIVVVSDLRDRVGFAASSFRDDCRHPFVLIENAAVIERRYEVLIDREAYRFLSGETTDLIRCMSGRIFGLTMHAKEWAECFRDKPNAHIPASTDPTQKNMIESLESLLKDLDALDDQIRQLRDTLEHA